MKILVIGGSSFVGRAIVDRALERGHDMTLFNRGKTDPDAFPDATKLTGDRDSDLSALADGEWDATIDVCGYTARQVRTLLDTLGKRAGHVTFISTISVYDGRQLPDHGLAEDAALLEPVWDDQATMEKYGELKVACEQVATELAGDRLLIVRPGYVIGPFDPTHRFTYWVEKVDAGGTVLAGDAQQPWQGIDARDLAAFTVGAVERELRETVHVTAPDTEQSFEQVLSRIAEGVGASPREVRWIGARSELPFTTKQENWPVMRADISRAKDHGLWWRPLADSAHDTLQWVQAEREAGRYDPKRSFGFPAETERSLLHGATNG